MIDRSIDTSACMHTTTIVYDDYLLIIWLARLAALPMASSALALEFYAINNDARARAWTNSSHLLVSWSNRINRLVDYTYLYNRTLAVIFSRKSSIFAYGTRRCVGNDLGNDFIHHLRSRN